MAHNLIKALVLSTLLANVVVFIDILPAVVVVVAAVKVVSSAKSGRGCVFVVVENIFACVVANLGVVCAGVRLDLIMEAVGVIRDLVQHVDDIVAVLRLTSGEPPSKEEVLVVDAAVVIVDDVVVNV